MPLLDVSEVFNDPMLFDKFTVIRRMELVNGYGEVSSTSQQIQNVSGIVMPAGEQSLVREEAFQTQSKSLEIYTKFRLRGVSETVGSIKYQPDVVVWHGDNFLVRSINDLTNYGQGFVHAECTSFDFEDSPPQEASS